MKKILITGSNGFIGRHLVKQLENEDFQVISFDFPNDIRNTLNVRDDIDFVIHLAAILKGEDKDKLNETNLQGTKNVVEFALEKNAKLIFLSTYVYGIPSKLPIDENANLMPLTPYAKSKIDAEKVIQESGINHIILRCFNIYGPGQKEFMFIPSVLRRIKEDKNVEVINSDFKRDFIYVDEVIEAIKLSISYLENHEETREIFNIGSGESHSIKEVVELILKISNIEKNIKYVKKDHNENEVLDCYADINKAREMLNWNPKVDLVQGLTKIVGSS